MTLTPNQNVIITSLEEVVQPSTTYRIDFEQGRVIGKTDGSEAMLQAIRKLLNTERYAYPIYSGEYGVELERLVGAEFDFISADIQRTVWEALSVDNRISRIGDFTITKIAKDQLEISFKVYTLEGIIPVEVEVLI